MISSRIKWPFPNVNTDPWYEAFFDMIEAQDATAYASREDRQFVIMGGGTVTFVKVTDTLSWSAEFEITSGPSGYLWTIPAGSVTVLDGQVVYLPLVRAPITNTAVVPTAASRVPSDDTSVIMGVRMDDRIYFRNGACIADGSPGSLFTTATDWAHPGTIGSVTPNTGDFTDVTAQTIDVINSVPGAIATFVSVVNPVATISDKGLGLAAVSMDDTLATSYSLPAYVSTFVINAITAPFTVHLPVTGSAGQRHNIKVFRASTQPVTVDGFTLGSGNNIEGVPNMLLAAPQSVTVEYDMTNSEWVII